MSFILDALRRADAQRQRAFSRGVHAHAGPLPGLEPPRSRRRRLLPWAAGGVSLLVAAAAWAMLGSGRSGPVASPQPVPAAASLEPVALALAPAAESASTSGARLLRPAGLRDSGVLLAQAQVPAARRPDRNAPPPPHTGQSPTPMPPSAPAAPAPTRPAVSAPAAPAAAAPRREPAPSPLPAGAPPFHVSGGVYSPDPAMRMVIINGQVYGPGEQVASGLVIEEIRRDAVVVSYRGQRYTAYY